MVIAANLKVELSLFCNMVLLFSTTNGKFIFQASAKNDVLKVCRKEYEVCFYVSEYIWKKNQLFYKFCKKYPVEEGKSSLFVVVFLNVLIFIQM